MGHTIITTTDILRSGGDLTTARTTTMDHGITVAIATEAVITITVRLIVVQDTTIDLGFLNPENI